jgi:hypothetical protein
VSPASKLTLVGFIGVFGWLTFLIMLLIPAVFPIEEDGGDVEKEVLAISPGLSQVNPSATTGKASGGLMGMMAMPAPSSDADKKSIEEEKPGFYDIADIDLSVLSDSKWLFIAALIVLIILSCYSGLIVYGGIRAGNLESRAWGITGAIMALLPLNTGGIMIVSALVAKIVMIQVLDDMTFIYTVVIILVVAEYLASVAAGVWALMTLFNQEVIDGFEYVAE